MHEGRTVLSQFDIAIDELLEYERQFLSINSFQKNCDLSFIKRDKLRSLYKLINLICIDSTQYMRNPNSVLEYLNSLFIITFRQIQYADLNQLYALKYSELLASEVK